MIFYNFICMEEKKEYLQRIHALAAAKGLCRTQKEFAAILGIDPTNLSAAMNGNPRVLTDKFITRVQKFAEQNGLESDQPQDKILVIPTGARAGTLGDFAESVKDYECERIISPVRGADYAMQITGDSMSPEYPSGSQIIIKKINEKAFIEWGKVYVLDTENGAVIKQVRRTDNPAVVECVSLNPAYQPFLIDCKYIRGWYRVLMVLALK